jgi:hypothetical protein
MSDLSYNIPSKQEMDSNPKWTNVPLMAEDYIIKLAKIELGYTPIFVNGVPNYNDMQPIFKVVCLPFALKGGGQMRFTDRSEAKPLNHWIFRDIAFGTGFQQDKVTPSFMRALICYMEGIEVEEQLTIKKAMLIDPEGHECKDEDKLKKAVAELQGTDPSQDLMAQGYKVVPDIRIYEGRYIGCAIEVDTKKNRNKISRFSKLPQTFVAPSAAEEQEMMKDFESRYTKMKAKQQGGSGAVADSNVQNQTLDGETVPF